MDKEMMLALELDGEKLRQLTGEDHGPYFANVSEESIQISDTSATLVAALEAVCDDLVNCRSPQEPLAADAAKEE